jgi:hypothetical protein
MSRRITTLRRPITEYVKLLGTPVIRGKIRPTQTEAGVSLKLRAPTDVLLQAEITNHLPQMPPLHANGAGECM